MSAQDLKQRARELLAAESSGRREADTMLGPDVASEAALRAIVAALRQQPAPVDLEQFRLAVEALKVVGNALKQPDLIAEYDRLLSIIDNAGNACGLYRCVECDDHYRVGTPCDCRSQPKPAPVVDDARMVRALWWLRDVSKIFPVERHEHLPAIEEAIAAYDPNCGARTVRVVDDAMGSLARATLARAQGVQS